MHKEYIELYREYSQKYGRHTAIFLQVGSFYELYDIQNIETGETQTNVRELTEYLGIQLANKKGDVGPGMEGLFAGFPDYVMHKWAGRLTSMGYTVVIVDQYKDARGKVAERKVSRILSPSTHIENTSAIDTPYVVTLWIHSVPHQPPRIGAAVLDGTTGTTKTYQTQGKGRPDIWTADDVVQLLTVYPPKEAIVYGEAVLDDISLRQQFGLSPTLTLHCRSPPQGSLEHELVRTEYLQHCYQPPTMLPIRTYLGLRALEEEYALLYLLQFIEEHDATLLRCLHPNESWNPHATLLCGNHALTQLQMPAVLALFDKCITVMGKRAMKERLLRPYSDATTIRSRLAEIQEYERWPESTHHRLERQLRFMFDLPRLHRKIQCGTVTAAEMVGLFQTYAAMEVIRQDIPGSSLSPPWTEEESHAYQRVLCLHFHQEKAQRANADVTPFSSETYPDIAQEEKKIQEVLQEIHQLRRHLALQGAIPEDSIRIEEREKEPFGFKVSSVILQQLKKKMSQLPEGTRCSELKSGGWVECPALHRANHTLSSLRESLSHLVRIHQVEACSALSKAGQHHWSRMEEWVAHLDGTQCMARVARERGWCCPVIEEVGPEGSSVSIRQLRHPLVEASSTRITYVKHDVQLGKDAANGWLLYGVNSSGKSSVMKATGLCVLLAQAGSYVPAQSMHLQPFQALYTRILNNDNLAAGLSSFAVEMSELRDILRNATEHTLVLGDELCSGTESISAQSLVASGIQWLSKRNSKFIFATHLQGLSEHLDATRVEVWHLHVEMDPHTHKLIYDRSLRRGHTAMLYGLEVARAMDLPLEFMEQAHAVRHRIMGTTPQQNATASAWNRDVVKRTCEVCRSPVTQQLEVHHVQERHTATKGVLPDGTPMNSASNLMVLCQGCHDKVHAGTLRVGPLQQTSHGPERVVIHVESETKRGKWSEEEMETVRSTVEMYSSLSLKSIRAYLSSKYGIEMSETMIGRIRGGTSRPRSGLPPP